MSELKATPGPWHVDDHEIGAVMSGNICVARGKDAGRSIGEIEANAHLIAASPELYEALSLLLADIKDYEAWQRPCHAVDVAVAALARARGETP